jgi:hypothetical protein
LRNLPVYCLTLASASKEVWDNVVRDVNTVAESQQLAEKTKLLTICLLLSQSLGMEVLELGIDQLGSDIKRPPADTQSAPESDEDG